MKNKILFSLLSDWKSFLHNVITVQEKILQKLVSDNLEDLFDSYLLWNEISFKQDKSLRIDTLWITKDWKLIIIEYKKQWFENMLTQPLAYSTYLNKYQWDVMLLIQQLESQINKKLVNSYFELPEISIICIANSFSNHDIEWSKNLNQAIWFYQYTIFNYEDQINLLLDCQYKNNSFINFEKRILVELTDKQKEEYLSEVFEDFITSNFFDKFWYHCEKQWNQYTSVYFVRNEIWKCMFTFSYYKNLKSFFVEISTFHNWTLLKRKLETILLESLTWWLLWFWKISSENLWEDWFQIILRCIEFWKHNLRFSLEKIFTLILLEE